MPNESQRWKIKEYIHGALEAIAEPADFNTATRVRPGHLSMEEVQGDAESPCFTYQDFDGSTIAEERSSDMDSGLMVLSIKGYKKTVYAGEDTCLEREREAERLLKDMWKAVMKNQGMDCNAISVEVTAPTRCGAIAGTPGWVEAQMTILVSYRNNYLDP